MHGRPQLAGCDFSLPGADGSSPGVDHVSENFAPGRLTEFFADVVTEGGIVIRMFLFEGAPEHHDLIGGHVFQVAAQGLEAATTGQVPVFIGRHESIDLFSCFLTVADLFVLVLSGVPAVTCAFLEDEEFLTGGFANAPIPMFYFAGGVSPG